MRDWCVRISLVYIQCVACLVSLQCGRSSLTHVFMKGFVCVGVMESLRTSFSLSLLLFFFLVLLLFMHDHSRRISEIKTSSKF